MSAGAGDDIPAWMKQQQEFLTRLAGERDPERLREQLEQWWRDSGVGAGAQNQELAARLLEVGKSYLEGLQQFAQAGAQSPDLSQAQAQRPFSVGSDLIDAWRKARLATDYSSFGFTGATVSPWLDMVGKMPPIGPGREQVIEARELAAAHEECQRLEKLLHDVMKQVQLEAFDLLQTEVAACTRAGKPPQSFRELYDLWVDCGERAYSKTAHTEMFAKLQADFAHALMRMRGLQRRMVERAHRHLDLPTRDELDTLHRQVRDLRRKLAQAERGNDASVARAKTVTRKSKTKTAKTRSS